MEVFQSEPRIHNIFNDEDILIFDGRFKVMGDAYFTS